jgi:hypothetical protein
MSLMSFSDVRIPTFASPRAFEISDFGSAPLTKIIANREYKILRDSNDPSQMNLMYHLHRLR